MGRGDSTALAGLLVAVTLAGAGWLWQRHGATPDRASTPRTMVVGVRGMSWQTLLDLDRRGELPGLRELLRGEASGADILSTEHRDAGEVLASLVTGRATHKHDVHGFAEADRFRRHPGPHRVAVWEMLARQGRPVGVVGFPFWSPLGQSGSWVVPDWDTFSTSFRVFHGGREIALPAGWHRLLVSDRDVPAPLLDRIGAGALHADLDDGLRACLAGDLTVASLAGEIFRGSPEIHVFAYLEGLACWERHLAPETPEVRDRLLAGYHRTVEGWVRRMRALDDGATTFLLFSEAGNRGGAITHRPGFPELERWPPVGWLVAWGRGIKRGVEPLLVAPVDLAATLLYVTGNAIPRDLDGTVQFGLLHDDFFHDHPVTFAPGS